MMSWLTEKWKEAIPADALANISSMETALDKATKDVTQYRFKAESLEAELNKIKQKYDDKVSEIQQLERQNCNMFSQLDEERANTKTLSHNLSLKENQIVHLNEEVNRMKAEQSIGRTKIDNLLFENNKLQQKRSDHTGVQNKEDVGKLKEACHLSTQRVEELKQQLNKTLKEKHDIEKNYEQKMQEVISEIEQEKSTKVVLKKQISAMDFTITKLQNEKYTTTLEFQVNGTSPESEVEPMKDVLRRKDSEIDILKQKLKALGGDIGEYLGINVRNICSETTVGNHDYSELLLKNKTLQDELDKLKYQQTNNVEVQNIDFSSHVVDSGVLTKHSYNQSGEEPVENQPNSPTANGEVLISRTAPSPTDTEIRQAIECERPISADANKPVNNSETKKLKEEITQMREIYENHMKVCSSRTARRSASSLSQRSDVSEANAYADELRRKTIMLEQTIDELQKNLKYKENYCEQLQEQIYILKINDNNNNGEISPVTLSKLEDLVDVIMQQKHQSTTSITTSQSALFDTEVLKNVVSSSLNSFQDELISERDAMRQSIRNSTREILTAVESIQNSKRQAAKILSRNNREQLSPRKFTNSNGSVERRSPYVRSKASIETIDELEEIRERIDNLQQTIFGRESEVRKIESERDRYSEELVKMVELMKKKDEEIGRLSRTVEGEKRKVDENDHCYRSEMDALKKEQLEIYKEFRDMCDNLKRKDIELLNKTKQTKLLSAEWREKEDDYNEKILMREKEQCHLENKLQNVSKDLEEKSGENQLLLNRLNHFEEQSRTVFDNLSRVEDLMMKAKTDGLY